MLRRLANMRSSAILFLLMLSTGLIGLGIPAAAADEAPEPARHGEFHVEVARLLDQLDSDQYDVRRRAAVRLEALTKESALARPLSLEFHRALLRAELPFEVRRQLQQWTARLPQVLPEPPYEASGAELDRLIQQAEGDSYSARLGATRRLQWMLGNPELAYLIMVRLNQRLDDSVVLHENQQRLESIRRNARGAWLMSDPADWDLPPVPDERIAHWIDELTRPAAADEDLETIRSEAERELLDLLARDECVARVKTRLLSRSIDPSDTDAAARRQRLLELTRPALVVECWMRRRCIARQHLLVNVPKLAPEARRPSHVDRIDDKVAHCVSGHTLSPGNYPVGEAIGHPAQRSALFHLINLSTPRRRMADTYHVRIDQAERLAALSRRTLDRMLSEKHELSGRELTMLAYLHPKEVSRFAGKYFSVVDDQPLPSGVHPGSPFGPNHRASSRFAVICARLVADGTSDAAEGLLQALDQRAFLPPDATAPYRFPWLAALSIAIRDPWPGADAWLAGLVGRSELLVEGRPNGPELGATAAGVLLKRHQEKRQEFGLQPTSEPLLMKWGIEGYRFASPDGPRQLEQWWRQRPAVVPQAGARISEEIVHLLP